MTKIALQSFRFTDIQPNQLGNAVGLLSRPPSIIDYVGPQGDGKFTIVVRMHESEAAELQEDESLA